MALNDLFVKIKGDASDFLRELKNAKKETVNYKGAINDLGRVVADLKALYALLSAADKNKAIGADLKDKIQQLSDKIKEYKGYIEDANSVKIDSPVTPTFRELIRQGKEELMQLVLQYNSLNNADKQSTFGLNLKKQIDELGIEIGNLVDIQGDVNRRVNMIASDTLKWDAMSEGIGIASNAMSAFIGVLGLAGGKSESLQKALTAIVVTQTAFRAIQATVNALQKEGAIFQWLLASGFIGTSAAATSAKEAIEDESEVLAMEGITTEASTDLLRDNTNERRNNIGAILELYSAMKKGTLDAALELDKLLSLIENGEKAIDNLQNKLANKQLLLLDKQTFALDDFDLDEAEAIGKEIKQIEKLINDTKNAVLGYKEQLKRSFLDLSDEVGERLRRLDELDPLEKTEEGIGKTTAATTKNTVVTEANTKAKKLNWAATLGWIGAGAMLIWTLGELFGWFDKLKKAWSGNTEELKKQKKALNDYVNEVRGSLFSAIGDTIGKYEELRAAWDRLSTDLEKALFVKDRASDFESLGKSIKSVTDAEDFLVQNTENVKKALMARALMATGYEAITKAYKKYYDELAKLDEKTTAKAGDAIDLSEAEAVGGIVSKGFYKNYRGGKATFKLNEELAARVTTYRTGLEDYSKEMNILKETLDKETAMALGYIDDALKKLDESGVEFKIIKDDGKTEGTDLKKIEYLKGSLADLEALLLKLQNDYKNGVIRLTPDNYNDAVAELQGKILAKKFLLGLEVVPELLTPKQNLSLSAEIKDLDFNESSLKDFTNRILDEIDNTPIKLVITTKGVEDAVGQVRKLYSGIVGCTDAWDLYGKTMNDADASSGDRFKALANAIFSTTDAIFSLIEGISALVEFLNLFNTVSSTASVANLAESASLIEKTAAVTGLTTAETANTTALIAGLEAKVAAETAAIPSLAAASLAKLSLTATENTAAYAAIPFAGPALAAAAMSEYMSLWALAKIPMFAEGGIVGGNARFGDYNIARVNSGEMILNGSQLKKLFSMLDSDSRFNTIGGNVEFKINGSTLRGVLNNDSKKRSKV